MATPIPPFRAEIVGSLLRPPALHEARAKRASGAITRRRSSHDREQHIGRRSAPARGGARRRAPTASSTAATGIDFLERIDGIEYPRRDRREVPQRERRHRVLAAAACEVDGKLARAQPLRRRLRRSAADRRREGRSKQPIPSPTHRAFPRRPRRDRQHGLSRHGGVLRRSRPRLSRGDHGLYAAGCRYLQIDETNLAYLCDPKLRDHVRNIGEDPETLPHTYAQLINDSIARPARPTWRSACISAAATTERVGRRGRLRPGRGGAVQRSRHRRVLPRIRQRARRQFRAAALLPKGKIAVLGLVTTKQPASSRPRTS